MLNSSFWLHLFFSLFLQSEVSTLELELSTLAFELSTLDLTKDDEVLAVREQHILCF